MVKSRSRSHLHVSSFFHVLTSRRCQPSGYQVLSTFHYKQARNSLSTPHFTVISEFISVIYVAERTDPSQNRSMKFSVGLPQPAYAFVSEVSVPANSPWSQLRQAKKHLTRPYFVLRHFWPACPLPTLLHTSLWPVRQPISISTLKKKHQLHFKTQPPAFGLGRVIKRLSNMADTFLRNFP